MIAKRANRIVYRIQAVALVDGILVVGLQLIEDYHMEYGEKDEHSIGDQSDDVRHGREVESHVFGWGFVAQVIKMIVGVAVGALETVGLVGPGMLKMEKTVRNWGWWPEEAERRRDQK